VSKETALKRHQTTDNRQQKVEWKKGKRGKGKVENIDRKVKMKRSNGKGQLGKEIHYLQLRAKRRVSPTPHKASSSSIDDGGTSN